VWREVVQFAQAFARLTRRELSITDRRTVPRDGDPFRYDAFISYSHHLDGALAPAIRSGLQRFARPALRPRALRVFCDRSSLPLTESLWGGIEQALRQSRTFVLLASPEAAASPWVRREVAFWQEHCAGRPLFIVRTSGELIWDEERGRFDERSTALPPSLHDWFRSEPIWLDLTTIDRRERLSLRHVAFRDAIATLSAAIQGRSKDDLLDEEVRLWRRRRRLAVAAAAALTVTTVGAVTAGVVAVRQRDRALAQERLAEAQHRTVLAHGLTAQADDISARDVRTAMRLDIAAQAIQPNPRSHAGLYARVNASHRILASLGQNGRAAEAVAVAAPRGLLAIGDEDGQVLTWDVTDPEAPALLNTVTVRRARGQKSTQESGPPDIRSLAWAPDGRHLAVGDHLGMLSILDQADPTHPRVASKLAAVDEQARTKELFAVAWSPDGTLLATGGSDSLVRLWDVTDPEHPQLVGGALAGHEHEVCSLDFSPDGHWLASASLDKTVRLWDVSGPQPQPLGPPLFHDRELRRVQWSPAGDALAVAAGTPNRVFFTGRTGDDAVVIWDVSDPTAPVRRGTVPYQDSDNDVAWSPRGDTLAVSLGPRLYLVDPADPTRGTELVGHTDTVLDLAWYTDDTLASVSRDGTGILWDTAGKRSIRALPHPLTAGDREGLAEREAWLESVAWSPAGSVVAVGNRAGYLQLWDLTEPARPRPLGQLLAEMPWNRGIDGVRKLAWSPDGALLVAARDNALFVWDTTDPSRPTIRQSIIMGSNFYPKPAFAWAPTGRLLAIVGDDELRILNFDEPSSPVELARAAAQDMDGVLWSPDGRQLAVTSGFTVTLWDVADPTNPRRLGPSLRDGEWIYISRPDAMPVTWSSDASVLAAVGIGSRVRLWDVRDPTVATAVGDGLAANAPEVFSVAWSPVGNILAVLTLDDTIEFWDMTFPPSPRPIEPTAALGPGTLSGSVAWSPDGRFLLVAGGRKAFILDVSGVQYLRDHALQRACTAAGGGLTPEQWVQFITTVPYQPTCVDSNSPDLAQDPNGDPSGQESSIRTATAGVAARAVVAVAAFVAATTGTVLVLVWLVRGRRHRAPEVGDPDQVTSDHTSEMSS
jgi:WD40 repeat protein